jgi:hypothetical protein
MKHATSIALHTYWQGCHGRGGVPVGAVVAAELAPLLPSLFLTDLDFAAGLRFRFCGAAVAARYGRDLTEEGFLALWRGADRVNLERGLRSLAPRSAGLIAGIMAETVGAGMTTFEMLLLPLAGESGAAGLIGSMVRTGGHEETNRIRARLVAQSLCSTRFLSPPESASSRYGAEPGKAATVSGIEQRYGHLTLLPGGKRLRPMPQRPSLTDI